MLKVAALRWIAVQLHHGTASTEPVVVLSEVDVADAGYFQCLCAHYTWLYRNEQGEFVTPRKMAFPFQLFQAYHLSMAACILGVVGIVVGTLNYIVASCFHEWPNEHTAHRYFLLFDGPFGLLYGLPHEKLDGLGTDHAHRDKISAKHY